MKLLLYSHYFAPSIGGVETIVMSLARGLAELRAADGSREFELTVVTQTPRANFDDGELPFRVVRRPGLWKILGLVRAADVVHVAGPSFLPMLLSWFTSKPFVIEHHGYQAICPNGLLMHQPEGSICPGHFHAGNYTECWRCRSAEISKVRSLISVLAAFPRRALAGRATANIAVSGHVRRRLDVPRSSVIQHGIEPQLEIEASFPDDSSCRKEICFGFVGRFVQEKGVSVFVEALKYLHKQGVKFEAKLVGDGPERPKILAEIAAAGLDSSVKVTGYLSGAALAEAVSKISVVVMPSVCEETAGLAAIEQMMRGHVVICSDIGGLAETVGEAGLKFSAGDAAALADHMRTLIENRPLLKTIGSVAGQRAQKLFQRSQMIEGHRLIYRELAGKNSK